MPLYPIVDDQATLETSMYALLVSVDKRLSDAHPGADFSIKEVNETQVAIILACLALGCQFAELDAASRQEGSQDLISRSNKCLQEANYTLNPSVEVVQALLLVGLAQQNLEQSDAAWMLLGMTHRMAQTLGMDKSQNTINYTPSTDQVHPLWNAILWQDALLCLRYDRRPLSYNISILDLDGADALKQTTSYTEAMNRICLITRHLLSESGPQPQDTNERLRLLSQIQDILLRSCDRFHDDELARTFQQRAEHLLLKLHSGFVSAEICRPGLGNSATTGISNRDSSHHQLHEQGIISLETCLQSFVELCCFNRFPLRSWSVTQAAISSSFLLALLLPQLSNDTSDVAPVVTLLRRVSESLWTDTSPPRGAGEIRKPCVGLSVTRMKASRLLAHILDEVANPSAGPVLDKTATAVAVPGLHITNSWAATQDISDWPLDLSLLDPAFSANMLDFELDQEWWLNEGL